jgi:hypothetical protein
MDKEGIHVDRDLSNMERVNDEHRVGCAISLDGENVVRGLEQAFPRVHLNRTD